MKITKNIKKISEQNSHSLRNHSNLIISSDYSLETLYKILSKNQLLVNQKDNKGETLLSYSIERDKQNIFDLILTSPILDLNYQDKEGNSYLHKAVQFERVNMIILLIKKGINLNIQNNDGNTPLHLAYFTRNKNIINCLIENNFDYSIKNNNGEMVDLSIRNTESYNFNENPLMDKNSMNDNDSEVIDNYFNKYQKENGDSEIFESIKIEWSGSNLMKKNRQLNLSIPKNFTSFDNLKSEIIYNKKKDENFTEDTKTNSPKYTNNSNKKNKINYTEEELNYFNMSSSLENQKENYDRIYTGQYKINDDEDIVNFNRSTMKRYNTTNFFRSNNITIRKNSTINNSNLFLMNPKIDINENFRFSSPCQNINNLKYNELNEINNSQLSKFTVPYINSNPNPVSSTIFDNINSTINENSNLNDLLTFLKSIYMEKYYNNFIINGFDDIKLIINQTKTDLGITENNLIETGVYIPGDRAKIIIKIQELAGNFSYQIPKEVYYKCDYYNNIENNKSINKLNNWLKDINVENLLNNFISNGYYSLELLLIQLECKEPLNIEKLKRDLGIEKIGFRQRIMNKLKDDKRKLINRLKKNIVITENSNNDICHDCNIF